MYSPFDIALLDHDLFGKIYQPSDDKSGFAVCEYIDNELEPDKRPKQVICHSYNPDGVAAMLAILSTQKGIAAPFDSDEYWGHFRFAQAATI